MAQTVYATKNRSASRERARQAAYDSQDQRTDEMLREARTAARRARSLSRQAAAFLADTEE